jgi:hypothetical protein
MASKRRLRRKACGNKEKQYPDQTAAVRDLIKLRNKGREGLHSYKCPYGNHWHLGHQPGWITRIRLAA